MAKAIKTEYVHKTIDVAMHEPQGLVKGMGLLKRYAKHCNATLKTRNEVLEVVNEHKDFHTGKFTPADVYPKVSVPLHNSITIHEIAKELKRSRGSTYFWVRNYVDDEPLCEKPLRYRRDPVIRALRQYKLKTTFNPALFQDEDDQEQPNDNYRYEDED